MRDDLTRPFDLVFREGMEQGLLDRPVRIVFREVEGLPKGSVKAVIDAYGELADRVPERVDQLQDVERAPDGSTSRLVGRFGQD
jgi:hypothetical protein